MGGSQQESTAEGETVTFLFFIRCNLASLSEKLSCLVSGMDKCELLGFVSSLGKTSGALETSDLMT